MEQSSHRFGVAIVAAGRGERAGQSSEGPKQYRRIGGQTVLSRTVSAFLAHPMVGPIAVAIHPDDHVLFDESLGALANQVIAVNGGKSRQESVLYALRALSDQPPSYVLIHDGVRPFVSAEIIDRLHDAMDGVSGALPALPVSDTLKRVEQDDVISATQSRDGLYAAQTPQAFAFDAILSAHEQAALTNPHGFTDDSALAEWAEIPVKIVEGSTENVKLTWAKDIEMAELLLSAGSQFPDVRVGTGYDVHALAEGRVVVLCGVEIPFDRTLKGHSDADVGLHALTDALLATCSQGDIGTHFPPSDEQWRGTASRVFVEHAAKMVRDRGGRIANVDISIVAEAPKIGPHREAMISTMASMLEIEIDRVSVKATTNESLGFVGRGEGIAALASATVIFSGEVPV